MLVAIIAILFAIMCIVIAVLATKSGLKDKSYGTIIVVDVITTMIVFVCSTSVIEIFQNVGIL